MSIEEKIKKIIVEPVNSLGIKISDIKYEKENGVNYLRIFIDKEPFINIDDCVNVTNLINPILDEYDFIDEQYMLDIKKKKKGGESNE